MDNTKRTPIRKAMERLQRLSQNEEMQIRAMARERALHDEATMKEAARRAVAAAEERGRQQQLAATTQLLLAHRFGELPPAVLERLAQASIEQMEIWTQRLLDAPSLEEVFSEPPEH